MALLGRLGPEHGLLLAVCYAFAFLSRRSKRFFLDVIPYVLFLYGYDFVKVGRDLLLRQDRVVGCELRRAELTLFGFGTQFTPGEWLQHLHTTTLDLLLAGPYFIFAYFVIIYATYLYFVDRPRMRLYLWAFAFANFAAFAIWLVFPAAPPWYVHQHGCTIDIHTSPNAAGLLRVDALLGIDYFRTFYSKSSYVFGAMPSMHCAFPMIGLLSAWPSITWKTKPLHLMYVALMFLASIYLDHHYLLDGLMGFTLAFVSVSLTRKYLPKLSRSAAPRVT
jgi:membrane-associated phospholipid phosphatase